eukprot:CAMPEP_0185192572 /NCGR_PEP_ID=MMETSP1140-20130426/19367_1 /TAXON_ID=298111 /ORGANISM="Pavlova sp., Strain CCMP459" /LENGTH=446 /DNA_ID=CAMNT_0027759327 /DNA_START=15 /DNA_END=1355 /DNA_ORIENTATION=+
MAAPEAEPSAAPHDLTFQLGSFLDRHLIFPLLEFLQEKEIYPLEEIMQAKLSLLYPTNMVDFAMDVYKRLHDTDEVPEGMVERRTQVMDRLKKLDADTAGIRTVLEDAALVEHLRADKAFTMATLEEQHGVAPNSLGLLYEWARFQFECGNYGGAAECLHHYRLLATSPEAAFPAHWGKLAAEILQQSWGPAAEELQRIKEAIEARAQHTPPLMLLQQRCWLMHWALYVFFNTDNGRGALVDLFFQDRYLNAVQTNSPHLLRYMTAALVLSGKRKRQLGPELARVVKQEETNYSDPLTRFVKALNYDADFDAALAELEASKEAVQKDFFLVAYWDELEAAAKSMIFESYCKLHRRIDIATVATKLKMNMDDAERWVVNLVRDAHLDARIDSQEHHVVINSTAPPVYQKVLERTKGLQFRSLVLANTIEQRAAEATAKAAKATAADA